MLERFDALGVAGGMIERLDAARRLREAADDLELAQVKAARKAGATWAEIGACYGLTKQGAQQRFGAIRGGGEALAPGAPASTGTRRAYAVTGDFGRRRPSSP